MPRSLNSANDLLEYTRHLQQKNDERDQTMLRLQSMWEQPIMQTETGRVVFKDNEPWTAARLSVAMLNAGRLSYKITLPPSAPSRRDAADPASEKWHALRGAAADLERFLLAHYNQTDFDRWLTAEPTFRRGWGYHAFVHGWHAGINVVLDNPRPDQWPIRSELWSPLDTFRAMDGGTDIVHVTRKQWGDLDRGFGRRRPEGVCVDGFEFEPPADLRDTDYLEVFDIWNHEINAVAVVHENCAYWLKPPKEHRKTFNPAWLNPIDAPPFKSSSLRPATVGGRYGNDGESNRWLGFVGQSPMLGWENNWKVMCQLAEMVAGNVERWGKAIVLVKTRDGKYAEFDLMNPDANPVDLDTVVEVIQPNKFPVDERLWYETIKSTVKKASYSDVAYGMGTAESERLLGSMRDANNFIIAPLVQQAEMTYEFSAMSILRQLDSMKKGPAFKRVFPAISQDSSGSRVYEYFNIKKLPEGAMVTASLRGAGTPQDKYMALAAVTQALNTPNQALPHEVLLEEFLDRPDPTSDMKQIFNNLVARSKTVEERVAPLFTLTRMADQFRRIGGDRGNEVADLLMELRSAYVEEQKATALGTKKKAQAMSAAPTELPSAPSDPAGSMGAAGLEGDAQLDGMAAPGAPPAGSVQPPTGSDPMRGALMAMAERTGGLGG